MEFIYPEGATPLDHDAKVGLIPQLTTQKQLNAFEQANISSAIEWATKSRKLRKNLTTIEGLKLLHQKMFSMTWRWAGNFRRSQLNIGIAWQHIPERLHALCADVAYWEQNAIFDMIEIAVRFHHKLVYIHPFPNGNGRFSRLAADLFLEYRQYPRLTWGKSLSLIDDSPDRRAYIESLRAADKGVYQQLLHFAKS